MLTDSSHLRSGFGTFTSDLLRIHLRQQKETIMEVRGTLEGLQRYTIHGGPYGRLFFSLRDDPDTVQQCQLPEEAFDLDLQVGDPLVITMLMRTVMEIRRAPATS
ncbi:MAG: hypothetical protein ACR2OE_18380 [Thermomicrobiales bacterium]